LTRTYQIHEFAALAGVTLKALRHYDRLGLLKPERTPAGYRVYNHRDLERLEQIVALKFLGLPLRRIKGVLDQAALELPDALRLQRRVLEEKHRLLALAIRAVTEAESALEPGRPADPAILKKIIEVIDMQDGIAVMKKYYGTEEAWERRRRYYEEGPSPEWRALYRDVAASLDEDPAGDNAQDLAGRWLDLWVRAARGDAAIQTDSLTAWADREHWPAVMKQRIAEFNLEAVTAFITRAALSCGRKYFSADAWTRWTENILVRRVAQDHSSSWQAKVDLFREIEASLDEDPGGEKAQSFAARWLALLGDDAEIKAAWLRAWADREHWPTTLRWREEGLVMMTGERFEKVAAFLDRACAGRQT
jgi:DNA-binding transcriptional MerR regulator